MQEKWIFPHYNESVGASVLDAMLRAAPSLQPLQTLRTKMGLTAHLLRVFSLCVLESVLSRKPNSDPSFQTPALDLDSMTGLPISVASPTPCCCHGHGEMHGSSSPRQRENCWAFAAWERSGKNFSPSGPEVSLHFLTVLSLSVTRFGAETP